MVLSVFNYDNFCFAVWKDKLHYHKNKKHNSHPALALILIYNFHIRKDIDRHQLAFLPLLDSRSGDML